MAKKLGKSSGSDRISNLPSEIIDNILICLPVHEAVRTSILSKKWRFQWSSLPHLVFDDTFYQRSIGPSVSKPNITKLFLNIFTVLLFHQGPILNFTFNLPSLRSCPQIDQVILYLSRKEVHEIFFEIDPRHYYKIPLFLFSCVTLKRLTLSSCSVTLPLTFQGFANLISLRFEFVDFKTNVFETFISKCPSLETLFIIQSVIDNLHIDIPYLKVFEFSGDFKSIYFGKSCHHLSTVIFNEGFYADGAFKPKELFKSLPFVEHLRLGYEFVYYLIEEIMPRELSLGCLRVLELDIAFWYRNDIYTALCLIVSAPSLEKLHIWSFATDGETDRHAAEFLEEEKLLDHDLKKLRVVKMETGYTKAIKPELDFIKFILAGSVELEKMFVKPYKETVAAERHRMLKKITRFRRASKKAEIVYLDSGDSGEVSSDSSEGYDVDYAC